MNIRLLTASIGLAGTLVFTSSALAQPGGGGPTIMAHNPANDNKPYDKHDLKGVWSRNGSPLGYGGGGTCRDCGDRGYGIHVPELTALGQKMFDANKPSYGRLLGSADAAAHPEEPIGRRRSVPPANGSDPYQYCNPQGIPRAILYPDPMELVVLPDRVYQMIEWGYAFRTIWTDGRPPLKDADQPRWWGYSTGKWDGDTFVVDTYSFDQRTWVDYFGYPHSTDMHLQERYKRTAYDVLELSMTIEDPKIYKGPWMSDSKKFRLIDQPKTIDGWRSLMEDVCAPADEVDQFDKRIRDPAGGVTH